MGPALDPQQTPFPFPHLILRRGSYCVLSMVPMSQPERGEQGLSKATEEGYGPSEPSFLVCNGGADRSLNNPGQTQEVPGKDERNWKLYCVAPPLLSSLPCTPPFL